MTYTDFKKKYLGKFVEYHSFDPAAKYQCADLANQWIVEGLRLPEIIGTNAIDFPKKAGDKYEWIKNTPDGLPKQGDLMIFNIGAYGHISIFDSGDLNSFTSLDQNYPVGSPVKLVKQVKLVKHNYSKVIGWLHPKENMADTIQVNLNDWQRARKSMDLVKGIHDYLGLEGDHIDTTVEAYTSVIGGYKSQATALRNELATAQAEVENRKEQVSRLKDDVAKKEALLFDVQTALKQSSDKLVQLTASYDSRITDLERSINIMGAEKGALNIKISKLEAENAELKKGISKPLTLLDVVKMIVPKIIEALQSIKLGGI